MSMEKLEALKIGDEARSPGPARWPPWWGVALGAAALVAGIGVLSRGRRPEVELAAVHSVQGPGGGATVLNASGYVTPRRRSTIAAKITARVDQIFAEEGLHVKEGQVLAILDQSDAQVRLASALADRDSTRALLADLEVNLANATADLNRSENLARLEISSQQTLDAARTLAASYRARINQTNKQIDAAEKRVTVARQDLDNCTVRAPYTGIVVSKDAQRGEMVSPLSAGGGFTRTGIATVVDMDSLEIEVDVNENYIARVKDGQTSTAILDAYPDWRIPAHVRTIIPTADRQKATVKVRLSFDHLDPRILPDMGVKVGFQDEAPSGAKPIATLRVPKAAVREDHGAQVVFLYKDGAVERRAVKVGETRDGEVEILAGLADGDRVVAGNLETLRDGEQVAVHQQ